MAEWSKANDSKSLIVLTIRGFESLSPFNNLPVKCYVGNNVVKIASKEVAGPIKSNIYSLDVLVDILMCWWIFDLRIMCWWTPQDRL